MEMSRLTRDGTVEPVSRDQILTNADREILIFPVHLTTSMIGNPIRCFHTLVSIHNTYIYSSVDLVYVTPE